MEPGFAESYDLGVGGGVGVAEDAILASPDDFVFVDDDCAYWDFAVGFGVLGFGYGGSEVEDVVGDGLSCVLVFQARLGGRRSARFAVRVFRGLREFLRERCHRS